MDAKLEQLETTLNNINVFNAGKKREEAVALLAKLLRRWNPFRWKHSGRGIPSPRAAERKLPAARDGGGGGWRGGL